MKKTWAPRYLQYDTMVIKEWVEEKGLPYFESEARARCMDSIPEGHDLLQINIQSTKIHWLEVGFEIGDWHIRVTVKIVDTSPVN